MKNKDINCFFKKRMLNLLQVRGINKKNKVMNYKVFKEYIKNKNGNINKLVLGPRWNRLVFIDIDVEV